MSDSSVNRTSDFGRSIQVQLTAYMTGRDDISKEYVDTYLNELETAFAQLKDKNDSNWLLIQESLYKKLTNRVKSDLVDEFEKILKSVKDLKFEPSQWNLAGSWNPEEDATPLYQAIINVIYDKILFVYVQSNFNKFPPFQIQSYLNKLKSDTRAEYLDINNRKPIFEHMRDLLQSQVANVTSENITTYIKDYNITEPKMTSNLLNLKYEDVKDRLWSKFLKPLLATLQKTEVGASSTLPDADAPVNDKNAMQLFTDPELRKKLVKWLGGGAIGVVLVGLLFYYWREWMKHEEASDQWSDKLGLNVQDPQTTDKLKILISGKNQAELDQVWNEIFNLFGSTPSQRDFKEGVKDNTIINVFSQSVPAEFTTSDGADTFRDALYNYLKSKDLFVSKGVVKFDEKNNRYVLIFSTVTKSRTKSRTNSRSRRRDK